MVEAMQSVHAAGHVQMRVGSEHHTVVVIGGGTAGITIAARLFRRVDDLDLAIIEPSDFHYYQPLWTLVGAGVFPKERSRRPEADYMPKEATWIRERVVHVDPDKQILETSFGHRVGYDFLVVAPGLEINWNGVRGLSDHLGTDGICSIYDYVQAEKTWEMLRQFAGGRALFTSPSTPIKCGGAPQKIMYLADDLWRRRHVRRNATITFASAGTVIFGVPGFKESLQSIIDERAIDARFYHDLIEIRPSRKEAVFSVMQGDGSRTTEVLPYDLIHVSPPMMPPDFIAASPLGTPDGALKGWMNVDAFTLQHKSYPNVFGAGDVAALPTAKTGAAVRKQAPVLVENLMRVMNGDDLSADAARYEGYTSCPIVTGYGKLILAEFGYENVPMPTFPFDQTRERRSMYLLKKYGLPFMYWNLMLKGLA